MTIGGPFDTVPPGWGQYIANHYGHCPCFRAGTKVPMGTYCLGGACPNWQSWGCTTWEQVSEKQKEIRK